MAKDVREIPSIIEDTEPLLRAISTPSCLDAENRATNLAFRLRSDNNESDLSLSRMLYEGLKEFLRRSLRFKFTYLSPRDVPFGAVELVAGGVYSLDSHIVLSASPNKRNPAHASICFKNDDGSYYSAGKGSTTDPVDESILGYELALASIVQRVYDMDGHVIWTNGV